jgi:hypothetical protein
MAYLRALDAHDRATAEALSVPSLRSTTDAWLSSTAEITDIKIGSLQRFTSGPPDQRNTVATEFRYASHWWHQDDSFPDGNTPGTTGSSAVTVAG